MSTCPLDCRQDRQGMKDELARLRAWGIPPWARALLIGAVATLFGLYGSLWAYAATTFQTRGEARQNAEELKEELRRVNDKLDRLLQRSHP